MCFLKNVKIEFKGDGFNISTCQSKQRTRLPWEGGVSSAPHRIHLQISNLNSASRGAISTRDETNSCQKNKKITAAQNK